MDYLGLNVTLNKFLRDIPKFDDSETVEETAKRLKEAVISALQEAGVDENIVEIIFLKDTILNRNLTDEAYQTLLTKNRDNDLIHELCTIYLDFYSFEHVLRRGIFPRFNSKRLEALIKTPKDNLESVIHKTQYYKKLSDLTVDTYRKVFDEYVYEYLKQYQYKSIGLDGIISKSIMWILELENECLIEKSKRFGVDGSLIVRNYYE